MSDHMHCPSCTHCIPGHVLAQVQLHPLIPADSNSPLVLQCAGCEPDNETGTQFCPAWFQR